MVPGPNKYQHRGQVDVLEGTEFRVFTKTSSRINAIALDESCPYICEHDNVYGFTPKGITFYCWKLPQDPDFPPPPTHICGIALTKDTIYLNLRNPTSIMAVSRSRGTVLRSFQGYHSPMGLLALGEFLVITDNRVDNPRITERSLQLLCRHSGKVLHRFGSWYPHSNICFGGGRLWLWTLSTGVQFEAFV